jgi:hypothetical protein
VRSNDRLPYIDVIDEIMRGYAPSLDEAKAAFKTVYLVWKGGAGTPA